MMTMRKGWRRASVATVAALLVGVALAQPVQYKSEAELMGAAVASPEGVRQVLMRLLQKCEPFSAATQAAGDKAFNAWQMRHRGYLAEGLRIRAELQAGYTDPAARKQFDDMVRTQIPVLVERQYRVYERSIDDVPTEDGKAAMCASYFQAIDNRQFDLTVNDPALAAFFDKRIAARAAQAVVPASDAQSPAPTSAE